jgi:aminoglycoside/choline kinase family phosphotransferase
MRGVPQEAILDWSARALEHRWPGIHAGRIVPLKGDASMRRFWRILIDGASNGTPPSAVVVDLGPDDLPLYARVLKLLPEPLPESPYVNVQRFLQTIGVACPQIYFAAREERLLLVEDVGDVSLFEAIKEKPQRVEELYKLAIDELVRFHVDGTRSSNRECMAFSLAYDQQLFGWEMEQFIEFGVEQIAPRADMPSLRTELGQLAARLGRLPRVFSHRDYHRENLFIQNLGERTQIRVLDFQDALMAPAAQDLAVLLTTRDTEKFVSPALEEELLNYYLMAFERRSGERNDRCGLMESYQLCVLQHALKVVGRFIYLERTGKPGYTAYLPFCVSQARRMLSRRNDFSTLREVFETAVA